MSRKFLIKSIVGALLIGLLASAPWLTQASAESKAVNSFDNAWLYIVDGCGTNCEGCGAVSSQRIPFGVLVRIEYACGLIPADLPEYHEHATAFVSAFGTVHGFPKP